MRVFTLLSFLLIAGTPAVTAQQVNVFTQANNNQRTGANLQEKILNTTNVHANFGLLWKLFSDAKIMAQPLYASDLKSAKCPNGCNTVVFCSMKGTVYAYMADQKPQTVNDTLVWARYLGDPRTGGKDIDMWSTDDPWWGILGTPVIDPATNSLYVVAWKSDNSYNLYTLDLAGGAIKAGPVVIHGGVTGKSLDNVHRKQRPGLLLTGGMLYVAFGGDVNLKVEQGKSAGWIFVYDAKDLTLQAIWTPTAHGTNAGIWQSGRGPAADGNGFVYVVTGDGDFDAGQQNFGDSIVKLKLAPAPAGSPSPRQLSVVDFFTPCNQAALKQNDTDLGSAGPLLFDNRILAGGKQGRIYTMSQNQLGKFKAPPNPDAVCTNDTALVNDFQATGGHIHGSPVYWKGPHGVFFYVWGESDHLHGFPIVNGLPRPQNAKNSSWGIPEGPSAACPTTNHHWMPGGILSVSADGSKAGTGIVWGIVTATGDANECRGVKGMLMAFDAQDVSHELWRSQQTDPAQDTPDSFGLVARFVAPTIANGKVFIGTAGDEEPLHLYGGTDQPAQFPANYYLAVYGLKR
jgi:hypothetical protein